VPEDEAPKKQPPNARLCDELASTSITLVGDDTELLWAVCQALSKKIGVCVVVCVVVCVCVCVWWGERGLSVGVPACRAHAAARLQPGTRAGRATAPRADVPPPPRVRVCASG
jgi:hypothetical protein